MRFLLDTATFIWAATAPAHISAKAMAALSADNSIRELSSLSISEIAIKVTIGKMDFSEHAVFQAIGDLRIRMLPYTAEHSRHLFGMPLHHFDPFDRQLIAQAAAEQIPIITSDKMFKLYKNITVIW